MSAKVPMQMECEFTDGTKEILTAAGWFAGRQVDLHSVESRLNAVGLKMFAAARNFLSEMNGLTVTVSGNGEKKYFDALEGLRWLQEDPSDIEQIETLYSVRGKKLYPIGWDGATILLISETHEIVCLWQWKTIMVFRNFADFMNRNVHGRLIELTTEQQPPSWRD